MSKVLGFDIFNMSFLTRIYNDYDPNQLRCEDVPYYAKVSSTLKAVSNATETTPLSIQLSMQGRSVSGGIPTELYASNGYTMPLDGDYSWVKSGIFDCFFDKVRLSNVVGASIVKNSSNQRVPKLVQMSNNYRAYVFTDFKKTLIVQDKNSSHMTNDDRLWIASVKDSGAPYQEIVFDCTLVGGTLQVMDPSGWTQGAYQPGAYNNYVKQIESYGTIFPKNLYAEYNGVKNVKNAIIAAGPSNNQALTMLVSAILSSEGELSGYGEILDAQVKNIPLTKNIISENLNSGSDVDEKIASAIANSGFIRC